MSDAPFVRKKAVYISDVPARHSRLTGQTQAFDRVNTSL